MSDYLPPDVIIEILSRLPVKSLLCFRCVCKSWNSLITSPSFINIHLNQAKTSKKKLLLTRYMSSDSPNEQYSLRFDNAEFDEYDAFECPFKAGRAYFRVVGVCNGLICLSDDRFGYTYTLIIWNPAIRKFLKLPKPSVNFESYGPYMFALGFGFDAQKNDFKVVRLAYLKRNDRKAMFYATPKVEVYAVSTGSWRTIKKGVPSCGIVESIWLQAFLDGSVHWTGFKNDKMGIRNIVLSFDMGDEKFGMFDLPEPCTEWNPAYFSIGLCGDMLAVYGYDHPVYCTISAVFVMKEYGVVESWSKIIAVEMKEGIRNVLGFREDGQVLLVTKGDELVSYEPNSKQKKNLGISGYWGSVYAAAYEESLNLLNGLNGGLANPLKSCQNAVAYEDSSDSSDEAVEKYIERCTLMGYLFAGYSIPGCLPPSS